MLQYVHCGVKQFSAVWPFILHFIQNIGEERGKNREEEREEEERGEGRGEWGGGDIYCCVVLIE